MPEILIGAEILNNIDTALQKEYITTNGMGGYASSTLAGCNTRRYHGLLVCSCPGGDRTVFLSKLEESITLNQKQYYLSTNKYTENYTHPRGFIHLRKYQQAPFPRFIFSIKDLVIEKEIFMPYGIDAVVIRYKIFGGGSDKFTFNINPLLSFKDFHYLQKENPSFDTTCTYDNETLTLKPYPDKPPLSIQAPGMHFRDVGNWYKNFYYEAERDRGLDFIGDLYNPGYFYSDQVNHFELDLVACTQKTVSMDAKEEYRKAINRTEQLIDTAQADPGDFQEKSLILASDMHCVSSINSHGTRNNTIVAGYHWFGDWGRDTFISLPGLTLCTRRFEEARNIFRNFAEKEIDGIIPNRFGDMGTEPAYNTVDASLWFINSVYHYLEATGDSNFVKDCLGKTLVSIIDHYRRGTRYGIEMDEDGLITAGMEGMQLTWMDARVDNWVVTPRIGKAVEINALWYNALCIMAGIAENTDTGKTPAEYRDLADRAKKSFNEKFWSPREGYLYDYISSESPDKSLRPNQLFAISLPHPVLDESRWMPVVTEVFNHLYIPTGIRSLDPRNPLYRGFYSGSPRDRDSAYHMGVAWGWLLGPFIEAYLKALGYSDVALERACTMMDLWAGDLLNGGLNTMSEIYDGDEPYSGRGCISQAWSVAEALRIKKLIKTLLKDNTCSNRKPHHIKAS